MEFIKSKVLQFLKPLEPYVVNLLLSGFWYYNYALVKLEPYIKYLSVKPLSYAEPDLPSWNCVCTIENGKLLEHYTYGEPLTTWPEGSLYIRKECDKKRYSNNNNRELAGVNNTRFLNIQYVHPEMKAPLKLNLDLAYIRNGNVVLNNIFVKRLLAYQYNNNEYVFDANYEIHLMDHTINKVVLKSNQYIVFDDLNEKIGYKIHL
jgi:hypothetical protein